MTPTLGREISGEYLAQLDPAAQVYLYLRHSDGTEWVRCLPRGWDDPSSRDCRVPAVLTPAQAARIMENTWIPAKCFFVEAT